jgi:L-ascorbate metabolism protein UlaG (beta-lactamase superfamily)
VILLLFLLGLALAGGAWMLRPPVYYHGPVSDHFDGHRFFNPEGESGTGGGQRAGALDFLRIALGEQRHQPWPALPPVRQSVPPRRVEGLAMRVTWIGHATALIQTQGLNILTDPVWATRDSPVQFAGPRRARGPGVALDALPPIDLILISHDHYDHMDMGTLQWLWTRDHPRIVTGLGNDTLLADHGVKATAGDWGDTIRVRPGVSVVITRAHHWSARWLNDKDSTLWCGFRVTLPGGDLYYSGDTGKGDMHWLDHVRGADPIRLALLPIAPYKPVGPQSGNHIDPATAVSVFRRLDAGYGLGVHWGTFQLGGEAFDDPPRRLRAAMLGAHIDPARFRTLDVGGSWMVPTLPAAAGR